jgi:hypothetical protein
MVIMEQIEVMQVMVHQEQQVHDDLDCLHEVYEQVEHEVMVEFGAA